jgi:hypothetical protein
MVTFVYRFVDTAPMDNHNIGRSPINAMSRFALQSLSGAQEIVCFTQLVGIRTQKCGE